MLSDFMPWWAWVILTLLVFIAALLEGVYRIVARLQPPLLSDVRQLLHRHIRRGDELREQREALAEQKALDWFDSVIEDLADMFSRDYAANVRRDVLRARHVRHSSGVTATRLIRETQGRLTQIISDDLRDENLNRDPALANKLAATLSAPQD